MYPCSGDTDGLIYHIYIIRTSPCPRLPPGHVRRMATLRHSLLHFSPPQALLLSPVSVTSSTFPVFVTFQKLVTVTWRVMYRTIRVSVAIVSGGSTTRPLGPGPQAPELQGPPNSQQTKFIGHDH